MRQIMANNVRSGFWKNGGVTPISFSTQTDSVYVQPDGKILVGGVFSNYRYPTRSNVVCFNSEGLTDEFFCANAIDGNKFTGSSTYRFFTQSDGKILIGGGFANYAGTSGRSRLVRLNSDGTLDTAFCANAVDGNKLNNGIINSIAVQSDGKILIGGTFTDYGGTTGRNRLVRLNSDGTTDTAFCANAVDGTKFSAGINSVVVQSDGKILVGGDFINYTQTNWNRFVRLNSDGTVDTAFNDLASGTMTAMFPSGTVSAIAVSSDGSIYAGGSFLNWGGTANRNRLVCLNSSGAFDSTSTTFSTNAVDGNKFSGNINSIVVQSDGKVLVGGNFALYAGTSGRDRLVRLNSDGTTDTVFCTNAVDGTKFSNSVTGIGIQLDGKILLTGNFGNYGGITNRGRVIRLNSDGTIDNQFCVNATDYNAPGGAIIFSEQPDGKILVGGATRYGGTVNRNQLVRLISNGVVDTAFCANATDGAKFSGGSVISIAIQSDGKILVGGNFTNYGGTVNRSRLIRLNSDGTLDTAFCVNAVDGSKFGTVTPNVNSIVIQPDGKILVGGDFINYEGTVNRSRLIRLNSDGTLDTAFCVNAVDGSKFIGAGVNSIAIQSDGKILIGGGFDTYAGTSGRNRLVRLNSDGTLDTAFCANAVDGTKFSAVVNSIVIQSDGKILVGGDFITYAGTSGRNRLVRLNSDGTTDTAFCANAVDGTKFNNTVRSIVVQSDGKMLVGGNFTNHGGITNRSRLIRLNSDGTVEPIYANNFISLAYPNFQINNTINNILISNINKIIFVGGVLSVYFAPYGTLMAYDDNFNCI